VSLKAQQIVLLQWRTLSTLRSKTCVERRCFNPLHVFVPRHVQGRVLTTLGFGFCSVIRLAGCTRSKCPAVIKRSPDSNIYIEALCSKLQGNVL